MAHVQELDNTPPLYLPYLFYLSSDVKEQLERCDTIAARESEEIYRYAKAAMLRTYEDWAVFPVPEEMIHTITESPTALTTDLGKLLEQVYLNHFFVSWRGKLISVETDEIAIELFIAKEFKNIDQVIAIASSKYLEEIRISILLSNEKYDESLMDKLLDIEILVYDHFPTLVFSFTYIPRIYSSIEEVLHPDSKLIYEKR